MDVAFDQAFLGGAGGEFIEFTAELLAQDRHSLGHAAVGLSQSFFAVKEPGAGRAAQLVNHLSGDGSAH